MMYGVQTKKNQNTTEVHVNILFVTGHIHVYLLYNVSKCVCICKIVLVYDLWSGIIDIT